MKKGLKIVLITIGILVGIVLLDTLQAVIFSHSPIISLKKSLKVDDYVDRGIILDTYHCTNADGGETTYLYLKGNKFTCPIEKTTKLANYDFSVVVDSDSKYEKTFAFNYDDVNYYYGNTDFKLFLTENKHNYNIETSLKYQLVDFDDILTKAGKTTVDEGSKLYNYDNFNIIVCNTADGNNDIIIGDTEMQVDNYCK